MTLLFVEQNIASFISKLVQSNYWKYLVKVAVLQDFQIVSNRTLSVTSKCSSKEHETKCFRKPIKGINRDASAGKVDIPDISIAVFGIRTTDATALSLSYSSKPVCQQRFYHLPRSILWASIRSITSIKLRWMWTTHCWPHIEYLSPNRRR